MENAWIKTWDDYKIGNTGTLRVNTFRKIVLRHFNLKTKFKTVHIILRHLQTS